MLLAQKPLATATRLLKKVADKKSSIRILANVCLDPQEGTLGLHATDLDTSASVLLPGTGNTLSPVTCNASMLAELVGKGAKGRPVSIESLENNWITVGSSKLVGMPARDYPKLPGPLPTLAPWMPAADLADLLARVAPAVSQDETRPHLNGIHLEPDGTMVATDGHRMQFAPGPALEGTGEEGVILPRKGCEVLAAACKMYKRATVRAGFAEGYFIAAWDGPDGETGMLSLKLTDAAFPDRGQVTPTNPAHTVRVPREAMIEVIKRASVMSSDKTWGVKLSFTPGLLAVSADNPDYGETREELEIDYDGAPLQVGYNARFLLDALGAAGGGSVRLEFSGELDPLAVRGVDGFVAVVMPMRI